MNKLIIAFGFAALLSACTPLDSTISVETQVNPLANITISHPAPPRQLSLRDLQWKVLTREVMEDMLKDPNFNDKEFAFYYVDAKGYENLSLNMSEIIRYIKQQKIIIAYYRSVIDDVETEIKKNKKEK